MSLASRMAVGSLALLALALPLQNVGASGAVHTISVFNFGFSDASTGEPVTVAAVGDTIRFVWTSGTHTATEGAAGTGGLGFDSGTHAAGFSFTITAASPGALPYTCKIHASMNGIILVTA